MTKSYTPLNLCRRGFNLIEAAIVLGVVGLVIGGIWVAAAAVTDSNKYAQTKTGYTQILDRVMTDFTAQSVAAMPDDAMMDWFKTVIQPPAGWGTIQTGHIGTYRLVDPYGYPMYAMNAMTFTTTPTINIGYISPLYGAPNNPLDALHCARMYSLFKSFSTQYTIVRWDGANGGCNPDALNSVTDFLNSTCCPGNPVVRYAATGR